ncbi:MAG: hypothetical protein A3F14_01280 [Gammaproteobacteria bacterium RIFCSPHIGHO2_12_FULL_43_28]|nr:MAG: hypothetical protein A3F14_01280 [Gammaproteobacteria bacterium RIFCSPHIGHO2_12_FULL_43_28]
MTDKIHEVLTYWFGDPGVADLPTSDRTSLWFGEADAVKKELNELFKPEFEAAIAGNLKEWAKTPRGRLALILMFDQFPRFIDRYTRDAFSHDKKALKLCEEGLNEKMDHSLTLIERVFFYMPLVHAEDVDCQERSIRLYQELVALSMTETTQVYQLFLAYAYAHFRVIKEFGRFPQRNRVLGRTSTQEEIDFMKSA